jgi:hypothetical protein
MKRGISVGEWINKLWYIHTVEYYSTLKRNEKTWRIKCTLLSERNQFGKATDWMIAAIQHCGQSKNMETVKTSVVPRG